MAKAAAVNNKVKPRAQPTKAAPPPPARRKSTAVALPDEDLDEMMIADAGRGVSTRMEDNIVPYIYVLQAQSPQAIKGNKEKFVPGAEAGSIWLRGTSVVFNGEEGILAQVCHRYKEWVEWRPNREGFVARHLTQNDSEKPPRGSVLKQNDKGKDYWAFGDNILQQSRVHVINLIDEETMGVRGSYIIAMTGSNHQTGKEWNGVTKDKVVVNKSTGERLIAPCYAYLYRMTTKFRSNDDGDWYMWTVADAGEDGAPLKVSKELFLAGRKLYEDFSSGNLRPDTPDTEEAMTAHDHDDSEIA